MLIHKSFIYALLIITVALLSLITASPLTLQSLHNSNKKINNNTPNTHNDDDHIEYTITQPLDQFDAFDLSPTYEQRYWVSTSKYDDSSDKPILFLYTCGEAPIDYYWAHSGGYFRDMGHRANALVVFLEHRFYGSSYPEGATDEEALMKYKQFLTIEQALQDIAVFIMKLRIQYKKQFRVVAGGGSYAGELAYWARQKYPHLIKTAIASSAPFRMMGRQYSPNDEMNYEYFRKVTSPFAQVNPRCPDIVRESYTQLQSLYSNGEHQKIADGLNLTQLPIKIEDFEHLQLWVRQGFTNLAQTNHPNDNVLASWPVQRACDAMVLADKEKKDITLSALRAAMDIAYDEVKHDIYDEFVFCVDESGCGNDTSGKSWDIQACQQLIYYPSTNNVTDMFPKRIHDFNMHYEYCKKTYGLDINIYEKFLKLTRDFPNYDEDILEGPGNVLFTTGLLDPWCSGSIQRSLSNDLIVLNIPNASHHLDLNKVTPNDPAWIKPIRELIFNVIMEMVKMVPDQRVLQEYRYQIDREYPRDCYYDKE